MKKNLLIGFIILLCGMFINVYKVDAKHSIPGYAPGYDLTNKDAVLVCDYSNSQNDSIKVFYFMSGHYNGMWHIFYKRGEDAFYSDISNIGNYSTTYYTYGTYSEVFQQGNYIFFQDNSNAKREDEKYFYCTNNALLDTKANKEICFSDTTSCGGSSGTNFQEFTVNLNHNSNTIYKIIENEALKGAINYLNEDIASGFYSITVFNDTNFLFNNLKKGIKTYLSTKYVVDPLPDFITSYIDNRLDLSNNAEITSLKDSLLERVEQEYNDGNLTEEEKKEVTNNIEENFETIFAFEIPELTDEACKSLLGAQMSAVVHNLLTFVQFLGPVLVAILTIIDFCKVAFSGDQEAINAATKKFMKRFISAALLFFIPLLINIIFSITGVIPPMECF